MSGTILKLQGLSALLDQLVELGPELGQKTLVSAARRAFKPVLTTARQLVPVDSGALRESLRLASIKPKGGEAVAVVGIIFGAAKQAAVAAAAFGGGMPPARRWHFIEFGTAHQAAHPFLRPALDQNASAVLELLRDEMSKGIIRAAAKKKGSR